MVAIVINNLREAWGKLSRKPRTPGEEGTEIAPTRLHLPRWASERREPAKQEEATRPSPDPKPEARGTVSTRAGGWAELGWGGGKG